MGTEQPEVSVIVLGYNGKRFLTECLQSVVGQDLPPGMVETIYADNGSSDGSVDFVRERFSDASVMAFGRNHGYALGNNMAFEHAQGRYVVLLNQDAALHRGAVRALRDAMTAGNMLAACGANTHFVWQNQVPIGWKDTLPNVVHVSYLGRYGFGSYRQEPMQNEAIPTRFVSGQCMMIDRQVVDRLGYLFDPSFFMYAEDLDLCLRLERLGYHCAVVPGAAAYHSHRPPSGWRMQEVRRAYRATRNRILAYYKTSSTGDFARIFPKLVLGAPMKAALYESRPLTRILLFLALVPLSLVSALAALLMLPGYRAEHRRWSAVRQAPVVGRE